MASAMSMSRRGLGCAWLHRRPAPCVRPVVTLVAAPTCEVPPIEVNSEVAGRTQETSTSTTTPPAKAQRVPPAPLLPGTIEDVSILENGVILVDKPLLWTSFDVCNKIRHMIKFMGVKKVGHAGTLDPNASGLLIVCTGRGTKFCDDFMAENKEYSGTMRLGEGTASYDAECEVSERASWEHITDADLEAATARFTGDIMQVPPMFSAIKVGGQKMYQLAREGQALELPPRPVTINSFRVWRSEENRQDVHFHVACSKGTYIRSLAFDMGRALGSAAHLVALRREASGAYRVDSAWDLKQLIVELERLRSLAAAAAPPQEKAQEEGEADAGKRRSQQGRQRTPRRKAQGQREEAQEAQGLRQEVQEAQEAA